MDAKKTGELIAALRRERGLNQKELAGLLGVTDKAVSRWETGRGYPDVELLPKLAKELNVSISELLEGERVQPQEVPAAVEKQMEFLCESSGAEKKKHRGVAAAVAAVLALFWLPVLYRYGSGFVQHIIGSPECVITADYGSLTYYGARYVPLPMGDLDCQEGEELVCEAQVEGSGFWGKLFFGETLWAVSGAPDYEIVYLQTEYDNGISPYYVLETKYDVYASKAEQAELTELYAVYLQPDGLARKFRLDSALMDALDEAATQVPAEESLWAYPDWCVYVRIYDEEHLFYRMLGTLSCKEERYYWSPCEYSEETGTVTYGLHHYPVAGDQLDAE